MDSRNERAPRGRGAGELRLPSDGWTDHTTPKACGRCGWAGDDREIRIIEFWSWSSPDYWTIRPTCPRCPARIERR